MFFSPCVSFMTLAHFLTVIYLSVLGWICTRVHMWKSEDTCWSWFSPPTIGIPRIKLRLFGLVASAFTQWAICGPSWHFWRVLTSYSCRLSPQYKFVQSFLVNYVEVMYLGKGPHRSPLHHTREPTVTRYYCLCSLWLLGEGDVCLPAFSIQMSLLLFVIATQGKIYWDYMAILPRPVLS